MVPGTNDQRRDTGKRKAHLMKRPTTGNTVARYRFDPDRPTVYRAMYDDGTYGPERKTRAQAEADYRSCPWLPYRTEDLDPDAAYHACRNYYGF